MGSRGRERTVKCEKCGRLVRRDKAVFIEKTVFSNPLDKKDVAVQEAYRPRFTREVAYCPGCGKHLRIYEKKIKQLQLEKERSRYKLHTIHARKPASAEAPAYEPSSTSSESEATKSPTQGTQ